MTPPTTVYPWEVESGDLLLGLRTPVAKILQTDGKVWLYVDAYDRIIARRPHWGRVQVVRAQDVEGVGSLADPGATPSATSPGDTRPPGGVAGGVDASSGASPASRDWCDPRGIARSHGLYVVTP